MSVDISNIRPGDKVSLVPLEVHSVDAGWVALFTDAEGIVQFDWHQIAAHHPAPREFQVGDKVRAGSNSHDQWVIEHIAYGRAWISRDEGQEGLLWSLDDLTRVGAVQ